MEELSGNLESVKYNYQHKKAAVWELLNGGNRGRNS